MSLPFLKSPPGETPVIVEGLFAASPDRVFRAWTEADEVLKWFGPGSTWSSGTAARIPARTATPTESAFR